MPISAARFANYKTGDSTIDDEHWDLVRQMNLVGHLIQVDDRTMARDMLELVSGNIAIHYDGENSYMQKIKYPYAATHIDSHNALIAYSDSLVIKVKKKIETKETTRSLIHTVTDFQDAFIKHIDHHDLQLLNWVRKTLRETGHLPH
jgi:hemerythrin-like metal-binding protein